MLYTEDNELRKEFIEGIKKIINQGYKADLVSNYAFQFYLQKNISDSILDELIYDIMIMDAGSEFELTKNELLKLIDNKLKI